MPRLRNQQVTLVSDLIDQYFTINDVRYFVHDVAIARGPQDGYMFLRLDVEDPSGKITHNETSLADAPAGTFEVFALDDVYGIDARQMWWADDQGEVHSTMLGAGEQSPVGLGGTVVVQPGTRCTNVSIGYCLPGCDYCGDFPECPCMSFFGRQHYWCQAWGHVGCQGKCGVGSCASEPVLHGCTCQ